MKKTICFVAIFLVVTLVGCRNAISSKSSASQSQPVQSHVEQEVTSSSTTTTFDTAVFGEKSANYCTKYEQSYITLSDGAILPVPSTISLFVGEKSDEIGFIYEYGLQVEDQDYAAAQPQDEYGNPYLYYGKLEQLSENVYRATTISVISDWKDIFEDENDDTDFFVVLDNEKFHLMFDVSADEIESQIDQAYYKANYYTFNNYI